MEIEKEIKQNKSFSSEYQKLVVNIMFTTSWLNAKQSKMFKPYGISPQQYNILRILRGQLPNPSSVGLLQDRMIDKMSNASRLVDKLKLKKLVDRKECKADRRQVDIVITDRGLELLKIINKDVELSENDFKTITVAEAKELNRILDKLRD
ncbi:MAG: winged helix-turn-helix transcriptional regulator [Bacteroidetes bacterium]|nr:winged helix-turn-helix transcriptional regulator [Bacteroidota bacterium]